MAALSKSAEMSAKEMIDELDKMMESLDELDVDDENKNEVG